MKLILKSDNIKNVYNSFCKQQGSNSEKAKLLKDKQPKTENEIAEIIGNKSWTCNTCNECGGDYNILVRLGEEKDYYSLTADICPDCLKKALKLSNTTI